MIRQAIIATVLAAAVASSAAANTVTYSNMFTPVGRGWSDAVTLSQFDPALGTLTGIRAGLETALSGYVFNENLLPYSVSRQPFNTLSGALYLPNISAVNNNILWASPAGTQAAFDGNLDFHGADTLFGTGSGFDAKFVDVADFTGYIGTGNISGSISVDPTFIQGINLFSDAAVFASNEATAYAIVTYTYDATVVPPPVGGVPEPASWAMLIAGFGLTGAAMRRRKPGIAAA